MGGLRVELEYFYRQSNYDQTADIPLGVGTQGQKLRDEIVQATDRIGSITSHNLFGNLFYDFVNTSRFTPLYRGWWWRRVHRYGVWKRLGEERRFEEGRRFVQDLRLVRGLPNYDEIRRNLAKTVSVGQATLSDVLLGFQVLFGVDYAVTEATSLGSQGTLGQVRFLQ